MLVAAVQAARAAAARAEAEAAEDEAKVQPQAAYIGRTTARSAAAAAEAAEAAAAAAAAGLDLRPESRSRDRDRSRRRRGADESDEDAEPNIAVPFAEGEVDKAPENGLSVVGLIPEFGRVVHELPPVLQEPGYAGATTSRDPISANKRKRPYGKRPVKTPNAPPGSAAALANAAADLLAPFQVSGTGGSTTGAASAMSQRRKYVMHVTEARSIGKRPAPQFTNYLYFRTQAARMQPVERLPHKQARVLVLQRRMAVLLCRSTAMRTSTLQKLLQLYCYARPTLC